MRQEEYRACMAQGLKGKQGLSKAERKILFCTQSKLCSGKAQSEEEAAEICALPKEKKEPKARRKKQNTCESDIIEVSQCMLDKIDFKRAMNPNSFQEEVVNVLIQCQCGQ